MRFWSAAAIESLLAIVVVIVNVVLLTTRSRLPPPSYRNYWVNRHECWVGNPSSSGTAILLIQFVESI